MSPILVRPVREQLEHDKVIRLLQAKYKRKFEVGINPGALQAVPLGSGQTAIFPDLVLQSTERSRKVLGVIEVETSESVNRLEAMSQWVGLGRLRLPFYLYVPAGCMDATRRLCSDHQIPVSEIWTYHPVGEQIRFTMIMRSASAPQQKVTAAPKNTAPKNTALKNTAPKAPPARPATARSAARKSASAPAKKKAAARKPRVKAHRSPSKVASRATSSKVEGGTSKKAVRPARAQKRK